MELTPRQIMLLFAGTPNPEADYPFTPNTTKVESGFETGNITYRMVLTRHVRTEQEATVSEEKVQDADRGQDSPTQAPS